MNKIEITPELLADLKTKAEKATPGNWFSTCDSKLNDVINGVYSDRFEISICRFENNRAKEVNIAYIAAANPRIVLALIERIEKLESQLSGAMNANDEAQEIMAELEQDKVKLEKEGDWLAERLQTICRHEVPNVCTMLNIEKCPFFPGGEIFNGSCKLKCKSEPVNWREAARKAMEERCKNN